MVGCGDGEQQLVSTIKIQKNDDDDRPFPNARQMEISQAAKLEHGWHVPLTNSLEEGLLNPNPHVHRQKSKHYKQVSFTIIQSIT